MHSPTRPEDILPEGQESLSFQGGISGRKGSIAAFLKNISVIESASATKEDQSTAWQIMRELAPVLINTGLHKHATFKNPAVQALLDQENQRLDRT